MILRSTDIRGALRSRQRGFLLNPYRFGAPATDPNFASVVLLLHMDGSDTSTTFTDNSSSVKTVTANGNAQIDTAQSKFGGASGLFDGTTDYLSTPDSNDFNFGTGTFTVELWIRIGSATAFDTVIGQMQSGTVLWKMDLGSTGLRPRFTASSGSIVAEYTCPSDVLVVNTWHHVAIVRNGTSLFTFIDGVSISTTASTPISTNTMPNVTASLVIGYDPLNAGRDMNGHLDDLRITKGVARYTSNFTPPVSAFPNS